jgi:hypothetical protein
MEAHYALVFAHSHGVARILLSGWRFRPRGERRPRPSSVSAA